MKYDFADPDDMNYDILAQKARYYKSNEEGVAAMCKLLEEMRDEVAKEVAEKTAKETAWETARDNAIRMLKDGALSVEQIARYTNLSSEAVEKLKEDMLQMA